MALLVSRGASVSVRTRSGLGPLHMAAQGDHAHAVRLLLQMGAAPDDVTAVMITVTHLYSPCVACWSRA